MIGLRRALPLLLLPVVAWVAGCSLLPAPFGSAAPGGAAVATAAEIQAHQMLWERSGVTSYTWRVTFTCECAGGPITVNVVNGTIMKAVDDSGSAIVDRAFPLTVDALLASALLTIDGGGMVRVDWGPVSGVPRAMYLDPHLNAIDDELSVTVDMFESG